MSKEKKYGLIMSEKTKLQRPVFQASRNVFGNDSDSDGESRKKLVLTKPSDNSNRQARKTQEKAVLEDPTVYQYDEVYDSMTSKQEKKVKTVEEKKPRYIENLMKAASKRKVENERRVERQVQKEREKEGDEFADKEVFVTSAYKKKLEEMRLEEEKEKREEYLENIGDVTKQKDLGGFYRHLYEQKLGKDKSLEENNKSPNTEIPETTNDKNKDIQILAKTDTSKKRNYRKRKLSDTGKELSDGEIEDSDEEINRINLKDIRDAKKSIQENIDADSDFIDESSDEDTTTESNNKKLTAQHSEISKESDDKIIKTVKVVKAEDNSKENLEKSEVIEVKKPKIDIWKKRTVGDVFDQAVQRYYQRKAARGM